MSKNGLAKQRSILLITLSGIGNFIMQSPVFGLLKTTFPESKLSVWVAPRGTKAIAKTNHNIDEVLEAPIKNTVSGHWQNLQQLRRRQFNSGIVLSPGQLWKSAAYLYLAGIRQRVGNTYPLGGNLRSNFLLTDAILEIEGLHDIEQNLRLLEPLGITTYSLPPTPYHLDIPLHFQVSAQDVLEKLNLGDSKRLVGFHLGAAPEFKWKRWPAENFITLGKYFIAKYGASILIFGGPEENKLKQEVKNALGSNTVTVDTDLLTSAGVIKRCHFFVSNDSGLMHLAAAVGTPTVGLFGPTDEQKTGPRGPQSWAIRAPGTSPVYHTERNFYLGEQAHETLQALTPEFVLRQICLLLPPHLREN